MKKLVILTSVIISLFFSSCIKKVNCEGTVYSKNGHKVPNVNVVLLVYTTGKDAALPNPFHTTTDNNGHFMFSERVNKNRSFGLDCSYNGEFFHKTNLSRDDLKHYNIHLN
jgi:hypothetical protein